MPCLILIAVLVLTALVDFIVISRPTLGVDAGIDAATRTARVRNILMVSTDGFLLHLSVVLQSLFATSSLRTGMTAGSAGSIEFGTSLAAIGPAFQVASLISFILGMIVSLTDSGPPLVDQMEDQIRGLITTGLLPADQRLPFVRQLASDLEVAPCAVAKAYRTLENEGFHVTRIGSGTLVSADASATPRDVLTAAKKLVQASQREGASIDEVIRVLREVWPDA